jgi:hypothetical protein
MTYVHIARPAKGSGRPIYKITLLLEYTDGAKQANPRGNRVATISIPTDPRIEPCTVWSSPPWAPANLQVYNARVVDELKTHLICCTSTVARG